MIENIAEAHVFAEKTGCPIDGLQKAIHAIWGGAYDLYSERMRDGDYYRVDVRCDLVRPLIPSPVALQSPQSH